jgi:tetratricopeptide (TPR) repeat protein
MRRVAVVAGCGAVLMATAGCALVRPGRDRSPISAAQSARGQELFEQAQTAIDAHDYARAEGILQQLVAEVPRLAEGHGQLGLVFQAEGRLGEAEAAYRKALVLDPEYVAALIGLGEIEAQLGHADAALARFETAIEIDPQQPKAHLAKARVLEAIGQTDQALAAYFRTLELDPGAEPVILRIATIQLSRNQPDQALARLDQALELVPEDPEAHYQRGRAHLALNHVAPAIADLRFAAGRLARRADVFYYLALAYNADHETGAALQAAEQALRLAPDDDDARDLSRRLRR